MSPTVILGIALLAFAGVLIWTHLRTWRAAAAGDLCERDRLFAWRQFRRRMQSSTMIAIVAMAILAAPLVADTSALVSMLYLIGMLLLVMWIVLLAFVDSIATRRHFAALQRGELNQMAMDNAEAHKQHEAGEDDGERGAGA